MIKVFRQERNFISSYYTRPCPVYENTFTITRNSKIAKLDTQSSQRSFRSNVYSHKLLDIYLRWKFSRISWCLNWEWVKVIRDPRRKLSSDPSEGRKTRMILIDVLDVIYWVFLQTYFREVMKKYIYIYICFFHLGIRYRSSTEITWYLRFIYFWRRVGISCQN